MNQQKYYIGDTVFYLSDEGIVESKVYGVYYDNEKFIYNTNVPKKLTMYRSVEFGWHRDENKAI